MFVQLLAATGVLAVLTMVPGPDMAVVTRRALASGWQDGLRTVGGISAGLLIWGALTVVGLAAVLAASATAYTVVKLAGAVYLCFLGVQALLQSRAGRSETPVAGAPVPAGNPWRTGLVSNVFNPKVAVFYTGLLPTLAPSGLPPHLGMTLLVLVHTALTLGWLGGYVLVLAKAQAFFGRPGVRRAMDRVTGVVLIGFGVKVAASQP
ncbi:threonine transporter RhtB (plasmid) [Streptomyces fungicidicus]|uniref:Threonine transporter RhtB n=1 Tax=Streptomyces fungicidicus TaxID=68203 RepID=A0A494V3I9_9ACTN|nr:LysE family translocator [Streptomyces fungicidicus]AYL40327.1 threonine transporter RhtB [Streptomyces fungicidicus]